MERYFDPVVAAATADQRLRGRLLSVMNMFAGPEALMHPRVMAGLVRHLCGMHANTEPLWSERKSRRGSASGAGPRHPAGTHADSRVA